MLNDKLIIELSVNHIYHIEDLKNKNSDRYKYLGETYPDIEIIDIQTPFIGSNLNCITIQDKKSKDCAIIYEGSTMVDDWRNDNLNNFLNKSVQTYDVALKYFEYIERKGYRLAYLGGNALGGGCAQYVGINYPHVRALCINASPLNKASFIDTNNIVHIRVNADQLHRAVALDRERYRNGYVGSIVNFNRSTFGSFDYYNHLELASRGSIVFPIARMKTMYNVSGLNQLKEKTSTDTYEYFKLLNYAPTLSSYIPFDLLSNNLIDQDPTPPKFSIDEVQDNFSTKVKEIKSSFEDYLVPLMNMKNNNPMIKFNDGLSVDIKGIIKYSLLEITKQDSHLYDNIYFVIEKSSDYFYKVIRQNIEKITPTLDETKLKYDQEKITKDIQVNEQAIKVVIDSLIKINNELYDYEKFKFKNIFKVKNNLEFNPMPTPWAIDYKPLLFDKIDEAIKSGTVNNRLLIEQIEKLVFTALQNNVIKITLPYNHNTDNTLKQELEYVTSRYDLANVIEEGMDIYKQDLHEIVMGNSAFYNYLVSIVTINEQLEYVKVSLDNLTQYIEQIEISANNKKHLEANIENVKRYIDDFLYYNNQSIIHY